MTIKNKMQGVTLIELMVALTLGTLLMIASQQLFLTIRQILLRQTALARIQENGRVIETVLGNAIKQAGNIGCNAFSNEMLLQITSGIDEKHYGLDKKFKLIGLAQSELAQNILKPRSTHNRLKPGNDILWVNSVKHHFKIRKKESNSNSIYIEGEGELKPNQIVLLSDCTHAKVLMIKSIDENYNSQIKKVTFLNTGLNLRGFQKSSLELAVFSSTLFYIGKTLRNNLSGDPIYALYSTDLNGRTIELVEGVEAMKIVYGIMQSNEIEYLPSEKISDWSKVRRVKVRLLLNSIQPALLLAMEGTSQSDVSEDKLLRYWWLYDWEIKSY